MKNNCLVIVLIAAIVIGVYGYGQCAALDINEFVLPNGLKVLHVERQALPIITVSVLIKASPRDEPAEKAGLSYLTAKLLSDGTEEKTGPAISEEIEFLGASLSASVSQDYTLISYASLRKDLNAGFHLLSDVLLHPVFPEEEIARKKGITKGALRQKEEDPGYVAGRRFAQELFGPQHPYGREPEGDPASIDCITRDDIRAFYRDHYLPSRTTIAITGAISAQEVRGLVAGHFGRWGEQKAAEKERREQVAVKSTAKTVVIGRDITQASILLGHEGISRSNPDYYAAQVMNYILGGGGFASRLMQKIRDEMGLTYSISSSFSVNQEPGTFSIIVQTKNATAGAVIQEMHRQLLRIRSEQVSEQELQDAKAYLTGSFPRRFETSRKIADFLAAADFFGLGTEFVARYPAYVNAVTRQDVLRIAQKYLHPDRAILVVVGKEQELKLADIEPAK
ncbi:MAG TPA: pitrilysin family protein [Dissulfurispiraceae bacterium]|nr:pitrilysin family protein [Dissulfurispiraceae bacterium]